MSKETTHKNPTTPAVSRRSFLFGLGATAAVVAGGSLAGCAPQGSDTAPAAATSADTEAMAATGSADSELATDTVQDALAKPAKNQETKEADIVVVGSGIAGMSCAVEAALAGAKVVILEKNDTLTGGEQLHFRGLPSFSPEMFKYIENADPMKQKQLDKGISQLMDEGVAQIFTNQFNGRKIIGTVGQLQFEVIQYRLLHEYGAQCRWEPISLYKACWVESDDEEALAAFKKRKQHFMAKDKEGRDVFLADSNYVLQMAQSDFPKIRFHFSSEF